MKIIFFRFTKRSHNFVDMPNDRGMVYIYCEGCVCVCARCKPRGFSYLLLSSSSSGCSEVWSYYWPCLSDIVMTSLPDGVSPRGCPQTCDLPKMSHSLKVILVALIGITQTAKISKLTTVCHEKLDQNVRTSFRFWEKIWNQREPIPYWWLGI